MGSAPDRERRDARAVSESLFPFLRRLAYALALVVLGIPALPGFLIGAMLTEDEYDYHGGYLQTAWIGYVGLLFILSIPFLALASGVKWVLTGKGFNV